MCGIGGVFGTCDQAWTRQMLPLIAHRGPDDEHFVSGDHFSLGARRLSIVDLQRGRQPLSNERGTIWAAQNGELYNFPKLQSELERQGHHFKTRCDTEVLPHLYEEHGTQMATHLDGMFAIALWDEENQTGLLIRDRPGKKPLYYTQQGDALYFASEIKCLLTISGFKRELNPQALHYYLSLKHVPAPLTIFKGIFALSPAHQLVFRKGHCELSRYWSPSFCDEQQLPEEEAIERLLFYLRQGIRRRLMADVPIGFYLSGGIDSSLIVALTRELIPEKIKTFTLVYKDHSCSIGKDRDRYWARQVARQFDTEHHEEEIHCRDFPEHLRSVLSCFDQPFAGTISTYFLSKLLANHARVALSGDGADELFGSYLSHRLAKPIAQFAEYERTKDPFLIPNFQDEPHIVKSLAGLQEWEWRSRLSVFSEEEKQLLYTSAHAHTHIENYWHPHFQASTGQDPLNRLLEVEFHTILPDQVLTFVDFLSMAHSLEVRSPFLDTELIEFAATLSGNLKISPQGITKHLLKRAASRYFPKAMIERPKEGFLMPIAQWLQSDLEDYVRETLSPARLSQHGLFQSHYVQKLIDRIYTTACDYREVNKVYSLLVFQQWHDLFLAKMGF